MSYEDKKMKLLAIIKDYIFDEYIPFKSISYDYFCKDKESLRYVSNLNYSATYVMKQIIRNKKDNPLDVVESINIFSRDYSDSLKGKKDVFYVMSIFTDNILDIYKDSENINNI